MTDRYYVYMIKCEDSKGKISFYTGQTDNPDRRFIEHLKGRGARYTKGRTLLEMAIITTTPSRSNAAKYEQQIKALKAPKKRELYELAVLNDRREGNEV